MKNEILIGDCRETLKTIPNGSVHCCVTSPPYWGLRDYGCDGQLGLERTPDEYVANMVEVFREVRRVLRDDGTCWVNLGDSYAGAGAGGGGNKKGNEHGQHDAMVGTSRGIVPDGLKPKDLCGIPWRVAFALQQPYYTGRIKSEIDRVWLAAMIEAEGCLFIHKRKAGQNNGQGYQRQNDSYGPGLEVANTHLAIVEKCMAITGLGSICSQSPQQNTRRKQTIYRWNLRTVECRDIIREVYPHLIGKQKQARLLCGCPSSGADAERAHAGLIALHNGADTDIDFKPPASMYEPGFYLRQDVIWSKPAPMPESVTDRCTKSHEYIFLLSKSERYYFDAEAIKEKAAYAGEMRGGSTNRYEQNESGMDCKVYNTRNKRSVWTVNPAPFKGAHFATYPPKLIEPCILAGCPERCCEKCGAGHERIVERPEMPKVESSEIDRYGNGTTGVHRKVGQAYQDWRNANPDRTVGWRPICDCNSGIISGTTLDPFLGAGTSAVVAEKHGRNWIGCELNEKYAEIAQKRISESAHHLFAGR